MYQTPRRSPRFPFIAVAEIDYRESGGRLSCQVATLNLHGCYIEMLNTLPVGREVSIKIFAESECFIATAKVVYELRNSAMGLSFEEISVKSGAILRQWLLKASGGSERGEGGRMATATAITPLNAVIIEKKEMMRVLRDEQEFAVHYLHVGAQHKD